MMMLEIMRMDVDNDGDSDEDNDFYADVADINNI